MALCRARRRSPFWRKGLEDAGQKSKLRLLILLAGVVDHCLAEEFDDASVQSTLRGVRSKLAVLVLDLTSAIRFAL